MSGRIKHETPMKAYDHVADLLRDAGGADGIISKRDAKAKVAELRAEGRGTEALAAENIFKLLDKRDSHAGQRVTGYDLRADRAFVEAKMLENRDVDRNGHARAEIAKMSPTGRALVELGQLLEVEASRGRIPHERPVRGLYHVAGLLRQAAKGDLVASKADIDAFAQKLSKQGRGTEALAVRVFGGFIDHRDAKPGARITDSDITRAVDYAIESLLRNKDVDGNGYSKKEVAKFSTSAKAFLLIGEMIEHGILDSAMPTKGKAVRETLSNLVRGQEFDQMGSEGGAKLRAIHAPGKFSKVDLATFREAFDLPKKPIQVADPFTADDLRQFIETNLSRWDAKKKKLVQDEATADGAFATTAVLRSLKDLKVFVTGKGDEGSLPTYIVGRAPDDSLVGLQTAVVWT